MDVVPSIRFSQAFGNDSGDSAPARLDREQIGIHLAPFGLSSVCGAYRPTTIAESTGEKTEMQEQFLQVDVPAIVARVASLCELKSDAEVSRWLDRADNYISLARKRNVIDVAPILARVSPDNWAYVLLQSDRPGSTPAPKPVVVGDVKLNRSLAILGNPSPEELATLVGVSPDLAKAWIDGVAQPSHAQLVCLFNLVAEESAKFVGILQGAISPASRSAPKVKRQA